MAADSPPAGGGINDVFPAWWKNNIQAHPGRPPPPPRRRRRRRGNQGQARGGPSSAVEQVDGAGAPTGGASGIDHTFETKTSIVSPRHANSEQTDDASTLAKGLLGVTLVPGMTVQSVPDVTSSPPVDQEVPTDSHLTPLGFSLDPPSVFALADALVEANPNPLGYRMQSPWDRLMDVSTYGPSGLRKMTSPTSAGISLDLATPVPCGTS
jgi:hypothetical protein